MSHRHSLIVAVAAVLIGLGAPVYAQTAAEDPVVARVNGQEIRRSDVEAAQKLLPAQYQSLPLDIVYPALVEQLIDIKLVAAEGREQNLHEDKEVQARLARLEDRVIQQAYLTREVENEITDEALRDRYEAFVKEAPRDEEVRARHILVETEEEAKAAIEELEKGADFAELAEERSVGPSSARGGDLGYFTRDQMVSEFADAAFELQPGEVTEKPVKSEFGWHVIKVEDRREAEPPSFEEAKEQLKANMTQEIISDTMQELRKDAEIEKFQLDGSPVPEEAEKSKQQGQ